MLSCLSHTLAFGLPSCVLRSTRQIKLPKQSQNDARRDHTATVEAANRLRKMQNCFGMNRLARSAEQEVFSEARTHDIPQFNRAYSGFSRREH